MHFVASIIARTKSERGSTKRRRVPKGALLNILEVRFAVKGSGTGCQGIVSLASVATSTRTTFWAARDCHVHRNKARIESLLFGQAGSSRPLIRLHPAHDRTPRRKHLWKYNRWMEAVPRPEGCTVVTSSTLRNACKCFLVSSERKASMDERLGMLVFSSICSFICAHSEHLPETHA